MLYAVLYEKTFPSRKEEAAFQHELAYRLLYFAVEREYGVGKGALTLKKTPEGKPYFEGFPARFSLSHTRGLVCCALSGSEIGVDAEAARPVDPRVAERVCTEEELRWLEAQPDRNAAFLSLWTMKEALAKFYGTGFHMGFQNAAFSFENETPQPCAGNVRAARYEQLPGYFLSVCCREEPPASVEQVSLEQLL